MLVITTDRRKANKPKKAKKKRFVNLRYFFNSMRFTMFATYFFVVLITLALMSIYIIGLLNENLYSNEQVKMFAKANIIAQTTSEIWTNDASSAESSYAGPIESCLGGTNIRGVVVNSSYTVLYDTNHDSEMSGKAFVRDILKKSFDGEQTMERTESASGKKMLAVSVPVKVGGNITGGVYLIESVESIYKTIHSAGMSLIIFSILIILLVGMLSLAMSYVIMSPFEEVKSVANEISKGHFDKRITVKGHNEISQMSETINYMCDELGLLEENRRKFVSDASHELKTPMAGIKLICDSLTSAESVDDATLKEFLGDISTEIDRLTRTVDRLLVLSKLDSGSSSLKLEEVDIKELTAEISKKLTPIAKAKGIVLYTDFHNSIFPPMLLDYDKMYEAIYNIVDNAIKYSSDGGYVHVDVSQTENDVVITVEDNGPGIPDDQHERIFERFYRLDDSRARDTGGTGLGLAITKEAVIMHGGTISVASAKEHGSIFTVTIPIVRDITAEIPAEHTI